MTKVNPNNGIEIKSDIFPQEIFKSDTISFFIKKYLSISMTFKIDISEFYVTKVNPNNGNETKSDIFPLDIFKSERSFFIQVSMTFKISQFYD